MQTLFSFTTVQYFDFMLQNSTDSQRDDFLTFENFTSHLNHFLNFLPLYLLRDFLEFGSVSITF